MNAVKKPTVTESVTKKDTTPAHVWLATIMDAANVNGAELSRHLGYARPNVIAMMRQGSMPIPPAKIPQMAAFLNVDPAYMLERVLSERYEDIWAAIKAVFSERLVTKKELAFIEQVRKLAHNEDLDLANDSILMENMAVYLEDKATRHASAMLKSFEDAKRKRLESRGGVA